MVCPLSVFLSVLHKSRIKQIKTATHPGSCERLSIDSGSPDSWRWWFLYHEVVVSSVLKTLQVLALLSHSNLHSAPPLAAAAIPRRWLRRRCVILQVTKRNKFRGFSLHLVRKFAHSILHCLEALYRNRLIHCDLKPENILLKQVRAIAASFCQPLSVQS